MNNDANQTPDSFSINHKKDGVWFALLKKFIYLILLLLFLITIASVVIGLSYKEDKSKVAKRNINLLFDGEIPDFNAAISDLVSPLDTVKKPIEIEKTEIVKEPIKDVIPHKKEDVVVDLSGRLSPNDFSTLNRKTINSTALNIIDPLPQMTMSSFGNQIPIINKDGDIPWKVYAKPIPKPKENMIKLAVLITNVGLDDNLSSNIIDAFDENVSLSFSPYSKNIEELVKKARMKGKETYIDLPLELKSGGDPGPFGIVENLSDDENMARFIRVIGKNISISGVVSYPTKESKIREEQIRKIITNTNAHGLIFIGAEKAFGPDVIVNFDGILINNLNRKSIDKRLDSFFKTAMEKKQGLLIVDAKPSALVETLKFLDKLIDRNDIVLVPVSALVKEKK